MVDISSLGLEMTKVLLLSDIHLSDKAPSSCTESYNDDLFDLLYQTVDLALRNDYEAVIWAGDVLHSKIPMRTSHRTMQRTIELIQSYSCPLYIVPGNHDMLSDRFDSVHDSQPLGVLLRSGAELLHGWGSGPFYGVPWLPVWSDKADDGEPSQRALEAVTAALLDWNYNQGNDKHSLLVTHAPFYIPGYELEYEYFPVARFADMMGNAGSVMYGHIHEPHGTYEVGGVTYCNWGALSRGSLHEYNLTRDVCVTEWDSVTGEFTKIVLDYKPANEVFRLQEVTEIKEAQVNLDAFLSSVGQATIEITSISSIIAHVRTLKLSKDIESVIVSLLEGAD